MAFATDWLAGAVAFCGADLDMDAIPAASELCEAKDRLLAPACESLPRSLLELGSMHRLVSRTQYI